MVAENTYRENYCANLLHDNDELLRIPALKDLSGTQKCAIRVVPRFVRPELAFGVFFYCKGDF